MTDAKQRGLVVILGPTSAGKSDLAVALARRFNGEIVSADSRQLYKGLNIGSGKITQKEMMGVPHHLLDVVSPKQVCSVAQYQKLALKAIETIFQKDKLPFLVGGSPLYMYAVTDGLVFPQVKPDKALRKKLEVLPLETLLKKLQKLDPERLKTIDQKNKRRVIRALEIVLTTKRPVPSLQKRQFPCLAGRRAYPMLFLGVKRSPEELKKRIHDRLLARMRKGMVAEVKKLRGQSVSWKRLDSLGLEYRWIARYLQGTIEKQEMLEKLEKDIVDFSRRQMTWFKKDPRIHWVSSLKEANSLTKRASGGPTSASSLC